jgi:transcriptional accessory protein Tex/SPT6
VTHFGAFIDIGVGTNGLVHTSAMNGIRLALGNRVSVKVKSVDVGRRRIGLELLSVLS